MSAARTGPGDVRGSEYGTVLDDSDHIRSSGLSVVNPDSLEDRDGLAARPPTSAEIDAVIAAAMANAPPAPSSEPGSDAPNRSITPLMTNLLPAAVGADGRVNLFVGNLPYRVRWQDLKDLFRKAGTVLRADVSLGQDNRSRGYGTVLMGSREDGARAIDRFNGYTWQTRTLEVRPDRLPPEYEPQGHAPLPLHPPSRVPMFPFVGTNHFGGPGHPGPGWHPQHHHRPPMHFNGPNHPMAGTMSHPGMSISPHPPHMGHGGSAPGFGPGHGPIGRTHSPASNHLGHNGLHPPISGQNTGSQGFGNMAASPLAGSLSAGADIMPRPGSSSSNQLGISPNSRSLALPRVPSPAHPSGPSSRPASSQGHRSVSPGEGTRLPSHGLLPTVPHPQQGGVVGQPSVAQADQGHMPHLEGLAHRSNILGPPNTLHDRVVFVSNLPLTMQWQELKDLLRPAGLIIRADVASSPDGRPRGFGTALFGAVQDAARAVNLFNGRELGGRRIRVYLERDSHHHDARRLSHSQTDLSATGSESATGQNSEAGDIPVSTPESSTPSQGKPALASRVPWHLNLTNQSTPPRSAANGSDGTPHFRSGFPNARNGESTPHFRNVPHPNHIAMPPWPPSLDSPNPLSPLQTRGLPPMTPSMPGFVFNNSYPDTPPVPHHFMGPFSPGLPVTSPTGFAYNPFLNPAPGAPVNRMQTGGSAQLGTPTTQSFPHNNIRGVGPPGAPIGNDDYFPSTTESAQTSHVTAPSLGPRTTSQSVLNARDRLAPSGPNASTPDVNGLAASMALHTLTTGQETPPSPTSDKRHFKRSSSGADLGAIGSGSNGTTTSAEAGRNGRFSMDDQRPNLGVEAGTERRASFGDSR